MCMCVSISGQFYSPSLSQFYWVRQTRMCRIDYNLHPILSLAVSSAQIKFLSIQYLFAFQHQVLPNLIYIYYLMDWAVQRRVSNILKLKHTSVKVRWEWCNVPRFSWDGWLWGVCELEEWWEFQQQFLKLEVAFCSFLFGTLPGLIDTTLSLANGHFTPIPPENLSGADVSFSMAECF